VVIEPVFFMRSVGNLDLVGTVPTAEDYGGGVLSVSRHSLMKFISGRVGSQIHVDANLLE
jgi:hypothetical protein